MSDINIFTPTTTFTKLAPTTPVTPSEFVFIPDVPLTKWSSDSRSWFFIPSPGLTNAGGTVPLLGTNGFSIEGAICDNACDGVTTGAQVDQGSLSAAPPE